MEVREAMKVAKDWLRENLADETITNLGIEEIYFEESSGQWVVTVGFSRPWDATNDIIARMSGNSQVHRRSLKVIRIDDETHQVRRMTNRD